jgi:Mg2+/Co2+ transporter CorB
MKKTLKKIATVLGYIYGIGIALALLVGGLTVIGYVIALCVGGPLATEICTFIYKGVYPILIYFASVIVLVGLVKMYLNGDVAFSLKKKNKQKSEKIEDESVVEEKSSNIQVEENQKGTDENV